MIKTFYVGIKAVIVENGKALILRRINKKGEIFYDLPGGRINDEEDIDEALRREVEEEISVKDIKIGELINAYRLPDYFPLSGNPTKSGLVILYYRVDADTSNIKLSDEHFEYKWISKAELEEIFKSKVNMNLGIVKALETVL